ncbi:RidA family protein [Cytophagales bacterium LB-30]|uniref:RidA family protein n=1 Tax=Shiella aurantiaca TaxID=3058365 RepID=A0ABT8F4T5_9BACT|nr:RidA family protein [Shiella aurantiaca]MDN4165236.1 RidA family protein [Shiella aurantiaca]
MKRVLFLSFLLGSAFIGLTQNAPLPVKEKYQAGPWEDNAGYTQAVKVGNTLYLSGHVAGGTFEEQVKGVYTSLEKTLAQYGATFAHVVKENLYTTDIEEMKKHNEIRKAFYGKDYPAATWVQISRLYMAEAMLEVEVIAVLGEE